MGENNNPYSKPSAEEQELWWKEGMKGENFRKLYDARIAKRESWNNGNFDTNNINIYKKYGGKLT